MAAAARMLLLLTVLSFGDVDVCVIWYTVCLNVVSETISCRGWIICTASAAVVLQIATICLAPAWLDHSAVTP